jgi:branched-chain amino acid transport system permease protein
MTDAGELAARAAGGARAADRRRAAARVGLWAALGLAVLVYPFVFTMPFPRHLMIMIFLYAMLAQAWNILAGYCGQISLGNAVFFGLGAYTSSFLMMTWKVNPWVGMLAGMGVAVLVSQAIGWPCFRLRGHYFAIATIAIGEIVQTVFINWDAVGGARGIWMLQTTESLANFQFHTRKWPYYYIALGMALGCWAVTRAIECSKLGYYFRAIKDEPDAAQSLGVNLTRYKLIAIAICAAFTAMGGTFYAQYVLFIDPESVFPLMLSVLICLMAIVGGVGTLWGPVLGAALMIPLSEWTRIALGGSGKALDLIIYGVLIVVIAIVQPAGLMGWARGWRAPAK